MKLDKDTLVKHQFWFLLGTYFLIWVAGVFWLKSEATGSDGIIAKAKGEYEKKKGELQTALRDPVNVSKFVPPWEEQFATFNRHKSTIWSQAWAFQSGMYTWPPEWTKYKDMSTPQTELTNEELTAYRHEYYPAEIKNLAQNAPKWLDPIELKGGFDALFQMKKLEEVPTREECWLVQEDFWVKRELLAVMWRAMVNMAVMYPVPLKDDEKPTDKEIVARYRYRNENWEITLNIRNNGKGLVIGGDSTIKNVHPTGRVQSLTSANGRPIAFNLLQIQDKPARFFVQGEPLAWNEERAFSIDNDKKRTDYPILPNINWDEKYVKDHPIGMSQGFDEATSPIRRLDAVKLCQQDCRTYIWPLQPNQELMQLDAPAEDAEKKGQGNAPPPGPGGGMQGGMPGGGMPGGMPGGGMAGGMPGGMKPGVGGNMPPGMPGGAEAVSTNETPNNHIPRDRYLRPPTQDKSVNPPSRHLPFAVQLIAEQTHVNDVLLALANSPMRVQITQVEFHHAKDYRPQKAGGDSTDPNNFGRYFSGPSMNTMYGGMSGMYGGGMRPPPPNGMRPPPPAGMPKPPGMPGMGGSGPTARGPMTGMGPMMGNAPPIMQRPPPGVMGGRPPGFPTAPNMRPGEVSSTNAGKGEKASAANQTDDNLVDVTIYGIAVLYRRPDAPKSTEQPAAGPGTPVTPSASQPTKPVTPPPAGGSKR